MARITKEKVVLETNCMLASLDYGNGCSGHFSSHLGVDESILIESILFTTVTSTYRGPRRTEIGIAMSNAIVEPEMTSLVKSFASEENSSLIRDLIS